MSRDAEQVKSIEAVKIHDSQILGYIQSEDSHGLPHAISTADLSFNIAHEPEYKNKLRLNDLICLRDAALLHDIGYKDSKPFWSGTQEEHPTMSAFRSHEILKDIQYYKDHPDREATVLWLIFNHDNTNYTFPAFWEFEQDFLERQAPNIAVPRLLPGTFRDLPRQFGDLLGKENVKEVESYDDIKIDLLQILQEADSRLGDAKRTLAFCQKRGIRTFVNDGGVIGIGSLWWQQSAAANIILALNRAVLDAQTRQGQEVARKIYNEGFEFIRELYKQEFMDNPGLIRPEKGLEMIAQLSNDDLDLIFRRFRKERWKNQITDEVNIMFVFNLIGTLRNLSEMHEHEFLSVATRLVPIDSLKYTQPEKGSFKMKKATSLVRIRNEVIKRYALDIFTQLTGSAYIEESVPDLDVPYETFPYNIIPPVISTERPSITEPPYYLLQGSEMVEAAKQSGSKNMRVIFVQA